MKIEIEAREHAIAHTIELAITQSTSHWLDVMQFDTLPEQAEALGREYGISDWAFAPLLGGELEITVIGETLPRLLELDGVRRGLQSLCREQPFLFTAVIDGELLIADKLEADIFIQYCLFGEVRYAR